VPFYLSPILYGVLAALMIVAMGNLAAPFGTKDSSDAATINGNGWTFCFFCPKKEYDYWWAPSRIILDYRTTQQPDGSLLKSKVGYETINEFPAFSFVLADLHPHVMGLPFVLLAVMSAYALGRRKVARSNRWLGGWLGLLLSTIIAGSLYAINTWDYPTYLLVMLGGLSLPFIAAGRREDGGGWRWARPFVVQAVLLVAISLLAYLPFHLTFKSFAGGGGPVALPENIANIPVLSGLLQSLSGLFLVNTADKTITGFMVIFGIFLLSLTVWLVYEFATYMRKRTRAGEEGVNSLLVFGIALMVILLAAVWTRFPLLAFLLPLIIPGRRHYRPGDRDHLLARQLRQPDEHPVQVLLPDVGALGAGGGLRLLARLTGRVWRQSPHERGPGLRPGGVGGERHPQRPEGAGGHLGHGVPAAGALGPPLRLGRLPGKKHGRQQGTRWPRRPGDVAEEKP
jgi:hypothetical protein